MNMQTCFLEGDLKGICARQYHTHSLSACSSSLLRLHILCLVHLNTFFRNIQPVIFVIFT